MGACRIPTTGTPAPVPSAREAFRALWRGRQALARAVSPGALDWIALLESELGSGGAFALAGALASMGLALREAYGRAGSEVRDLIWALHRFIKDPAPPPPAALKPFAPWLRALSAEDRDSLRRVMFLWLEVANERLTMPAYHRADQRSRHARALLAAPLELLRPEGSGDALNPRGALARWAELILRFHDLLDAERQGALGRNRVDPPSSDGFGGFYGLAVQPTPPTPEALSRALASLEDDLRSFKPAELGPGLTRVGARTRSKMLGALRDRRSLGRWPERFLPPDPARRSAGPLARLLARLRSLLARD